MHKLKKIINKLADPGALLLYLTSKEGAEEVFWRQEIQKYQKWLQGSLPSLYNTASPAPEEIVWAQNIKDSAVLTWHKKHQEKKYLRDLALLPDAFSGMKVLDIGAGPIPSATSFKNCELYCLEPLLDRYLAAGFPIHYYPSTTYIHGQSESIPITDNFFDVVISVNAIDHVNDLAKTSQEIERVLKPGGRFRMHVHYHPPTRAEPIHFTDDSFTNIFSWCKGLYKISQTQENFSNVLKGNESYALWTNFE